MNTIKDLLKNHSEQPSEEVWQKLNARLDAEMPVGKSSFWSGFSTAKKAVAATVAGLLVLGGVALGYVMMHKGESTKSQEIASVKPMQKAEEATETENAIVVEEAVVEPTVKENPAEKVVANVEEKTAPAKETAPATQESAPKTPVKSHVKQEVLPANSTLAKQLAADPVLKNLSDGCAECAKPAHLSIPNLFTPNGDGVNDLFVIEGLEHYSSPKLVVRDKNGRQVYQSNSYQNTWGGENCPEGLYSYEFTFFYNGIENQATGKVRIIRS